MPCPSMSLYSEKETDCREYRTSERSAVFDLMFCRLSRYVRSGELQSRPVVLKRYCHQEPRGVQ